MSDGFEVKGQNLTDESEVECALLIPFLIVTPDAKIGVRQVTLLIQNDAISADQLVLSHYYKTSRQLEFNVAVS